MRSYIEREGYVPFSGDIGEQLRELLDLYTNCNKVQFGGEEVCHLHKEQARKGGCDKAIVHCVTKSGTVTASVSMLHEPDSS